MRLVLVVGAWRLICRLAAPAIVIALATLLLGSRSFARHDERHVPDAVERVVQRIDHELGPTIGIALHR